MLKLFVIKAVAIFSIVAASAEGNPLIGEWVFVKLASGTRVPEGMQVVWTFSKNKIVVVERISGEKVTEHTYSIDTSKSPSHIVQNISDSLTGNDKDKRLGIFKIIGDELHLATEAKDGGERPAKFTKKNTAIYKKFVVK